MDCQTFQQRNCKQEETQISESERAIIKMEGYLKILNHEEARQIMRVRLNMVNVKANYRGSYKDYTCSGCHIHEDTTEHLFKCWKTVHFTGIEANLEWICNEHRHELIQIVHVIDAIEEFKETKME